VSSRNILIQEKINPEISWNIGMGLVHNFYIRGRKLMLGAEFYRTEFMNQLITDLDQHTTHAIFYNLNGKSYSNSFQADVLFEITSNLLIKATYKLNDVKTTYNNKLLYRLMIPRHNGLFNAAYTTHNNKWLFDLTVNFTGKARLAHNAYTEAGKELQRFSPVYAVLNAQITKKWKIIDWYVGGENLTHFRQQNPIVDAHNPFSPTFDASMVWGPIVGIVVYTGIRLTMQ
jgi:outer membrane receptor protein involved in Fe transport